MPPEMGFTDMPKAFSAALGEDTTTSVVWCVMPLSFGQGTNQCDLSMYKPHDARFVVRSQSSQTTRTLGSRINDWKSTNVKRRWIARLWLAEHEIRFIWVARLCISDRPALAKVIKAFHDRKSAESGRCGSTSRPRTTKKSRSEIMDIRDRLYRPEFWAAKILIESRNAHMNGHSKTCHVWSARYIAQETGYEARAGENACMDRGLYQGSHMSIKVIRFLGTWFFISE